MDGMLYRASYICNVTSFYLNTHNRTGGKKKPEQSTHVIHSTLVKRFIADEITRNPTWPGDGDCIYAMGVLLRAALISIDTWHLCRLVSVVAVGVRSSKEKKQKRKRKKEENKINSADDDDDDDLGSTTQ